MAFKNLKKEKGMVCMIKKVLVYGHKRD